MAVSRNKQAASASGSETKTRAEAEFEKYKARVGWPPSATGSAPAPAGPMPGVMGVSLPGGVAAVPAWPSGPFAAGPPYGAGMPFFGAAVPPVEMAAGSLTERLRYTLRLGVDVVNAGLAGGLRVLGGVSEIAEAIGPYGHGCGGCGCSHGGHETWCCRYEDCCCESDCGCHPGVHSCGCGCGCCC